MHALNRLKPLVGRTRSRLGFPVDARQASQRSWQLAPAQRTPVPPALFDQADLAKITGVAAPSSSIAAQIDRLQAASVEHAATTAYELHDAVLSRGHLFTFKSVTHLSQLKLPLLSSRRPRRFSHAAMASSWVGCRYFGHWLMDDLPLLLAAREIAHPVSVLTDPSPSQRDYMKLLDLHAEPLAEATFERIVLIDDVGQNDYKRARQHQINDLARQRFPESRGGRVMLLRGSSGVRRMLTNEQQLADVMRARGFVILDPLKVSALELLTTCVGADIVLGVEGSHVLNGARWMARSGTLLVIQPPGRFDLVVKDFCDCVGIQYAFAIGDTVSDTDFSVDIAAVEALLDRALACDRQAAEL